MSFRSPSEIQVTSRQIPAWGRIPNTSIQSKPLLIYHGAFNASPNEVRAYLQDIGEVAPQWTYTMYSETHFHSTTHEVLAIISGRARLCFGGEENPERFEPAVERGDVIIVPAGVSHRLLQELDTGKGGFQMIGSYPHQKQWDMCYGRPGEEEKVKNIEGLEWFRRDPFFGADGPALHV